MRTQDLTGRVFGRWQVIRFSHYIGDDTRHRRYYWLCKCECGTERAVDRSALVNNVSVSCGCYHREVVGRNSTRHGMVGTPEYHAWQHMKDRCDNPLSASYEDYGGRGIKICAAWYSFPNFFLDMGLRPSAQHSLERVDNNRGYSPENCIWAKPIVQCNNTRANRRLRFDGRVQTLAEWGRETGIRAATIWNRLDDGWTTAEALSTPVSKQKGGWDLRRARQFR